MKEQISEEFARKLLEESYNFESTIVGRTGWINECIDHWKKVGYIKQSREEELKEKILEKIYNELIEILDNKNKGV